MTAAQAPGGLLRPRDPYEALLDGLHPRLEAIETETRAVDVRLDDDELTDLLEQLWLAIDDAIGPDQAIELVDACPYVWEWTDGAGSSVDTLRWYAVGALRHDAYERLVGDDLELARFVLDPASTWSPDR